MNLRSVGRNGLLSAIGLASLGLSTVVITATASRAIPGLPFATFSVWWTLSLSIGLCFLRSGDLPAMVLGDALLDGGDGRGIQAAMSRRALVALGLVTASAVTLSPWAIDRWFGGDRLLMALAIAYVVVLGLQSYQRGAAVAQGGFSALAAQLTADGAVRTLAALTLAATDTATPRSLAAAVVVSGALSLVVGSTYCRTWWAWSGPTAAWPWSPLLALFVAALGPSIMNNATVPWLSNQPEAGPYVVGAFAGALGPSQIPMMFVSAVYAPVIRPLADAASRGDHEGVRRTYRLTLGFGAAISVAAVAVGWLLWPWLVTLYLGTQDTISSPVAAILALTGGLSLITAGSQAAVVAQARWAASPRASIVALIGFVTVLVLLRWAPQLVAAVAGLVGSCLILVVLMSHVTGSSVVPRRATSRG